MARKIISRPSLPVNSKGEVLATVGKGDSIVAGTIKKGQFPVDAATGALVINGLNVPHNPAYKKKANSQYLSGRQRDLSDFNFEALQANGTLYMASNLRTTNVNGVANTFTRMTETNGALTGASPSSVPNTDRAFWRMTLLPTTPVTAGRPRILLNGWDCEPYVHYRMKMVFRLKNNDNYGWSTRAAELFSGSIFALSQQSNATSVAEFSPGQPAAGSSPLYLKIRGNLMWPDMRSIAEDMGAASDDLSAPYTYTSWGDGDTEFRTRRKTPVRVLNGDHFHEVILDFYIDERRLKDGGQGYFRATFDGEHWFEHKGPTSQPRNVDGELIAIMPRWGLYETESTPLGNQVDGTQCGTISSCTIERSVDFFLIDCMEVTP